MKILYISRLSSNIAAGLAWSVPAGVNAQSKIDDVLWINASDAFIPHWANVSAYHNYKEYGGLKLENLPAPFSKPDLVVFEGFNFIQHAKLSRTLNKRCIPYVIVPRGALTYEAQHNHSMWKKRLANLLFLNKYVKKSSAIQFLTVGERENSVGYNKNTNFILPNGFDDPGKYKTSFSERSVRATFIGRLDMHHKGLDLLLNVLEKNKTLLDKKHFHLSIYGPKRHDYNKIKDLIVEKGIEKVATIVDEISGKEKENLLLSTDLFIMTSRLEGHPMGLIEALAYGVPCLVSRGTNMYDEVLTSGAGWVCETDEDSIEGSLLRMLEETNTFKDKSLAARELASKYQWDKLAQQFHDKIIELKIVKE